MSAAQNLHRVCIAGASGRMGQMLVDAVRASGDCVLSGALDVPGSPAIGLDAGAFGGQATGVAITADLAAPDLEKCDLRILATDIDANVIEKAKAGVYDRRLIGENVPAALSRFLQDGPGAGQVTVAPKLRTFIRFEVLNLLQPWPFQGKFDVIFCRNVVIYFDDKTRYDLWHRLAG